jgi:hypothetical protein
LLLELELRVEAFLLLMPCLPGRERGWFWTFFEFGWYLATNRLGLTALGDLKPNWLGLIALGRCQAESTWFNCFRRSQAESAWFHCFRRSQAETAWFNALGDLKPKRLGLML